MSPLNSARLGTSPFVRVLTLVPSLLAAIALFCLMVMTFFDVVLRSVLNDPIESATELTRLLMAIIVFASLPIVSWRREHIVVDLLDSFYNSFFARIRNVVVDGLCGLLLLWPGYRVFELAGRARSYGDTTEYLEIPQFYVAYFIAAATMITAIVLILRAVTGWFNPAYGRESDPPGGS